MAHALDNRSIYRFPLQVCFDLCNDGTNTHFGTQYAREVKLTRDSDKVFECFSVSPRVPYSSEMVCYFGPTNTNVFPITSASEVRKSYSLNYYDIICVCWSCTVGL